MELEKKILLKYDESIRTILKKLKRMNYYFSLKTKRYKS